MGVEPKLATATAGTMHITYDQFSQLMEDKNVKQFLYAIGDVGYARMVGIKDDAWGHLEKVASKLYAAATDYEPSVHLTRKRIAHNTFGYLATKV